MIKILFVCMGNICRSPSGEAVMNGLIVKNNLQDRVKCDSAGTIAYHTGEPADSRMQNHAIKRGYELTSIARQIKHYDFNRFNYIIAMDRENYKNILILDSEEKYKNKVSMMLDYAINYNDSDVPDPYYGGEQGFEYVLDLLEDACLGLLKHIIKSDL
ncbi:MAG: low molecular weight phosphotyrosine protein phosphatase [Melioribacteraceae bacterium]|nr:low molecular weight phosphotyrosine protein phosphatase [Melioribacteraceae bacterium]